MVVSHHPKTTGCKFRLLSSFEFHHHIQCPSSRKFTMHQGVSHVPWVSFPHKFSTPILLPKKILLSLFSNHRSWFIFIFYYVGNVVVGVVHMGACEKEGKKEGWWFTRLLCVGWMFVYNEIWRFLYEDFTTGCLLWSSFLFLWPPWFPTGYFFKSNTTRTYTFFQNGRCPQCQSIKP